MEGRYDRAFRYTCYGLAAATVFAGDFQDSRIGPEEIRVAVRWGVLALDAIVGGIGAGVAIARSGEGSVGYGAISGAFAGGFFGVALEEAGAEYLSFFN